MSSVVGSLTNSTIYSILKDVMTIRSILNYWHKFKELQQRLFNFLVLHVVYFLGIGVTACVARVVGKHFLTYQHSTSSWQKAGTTKSVVPEHMF
jgi:ABC-type antimicrobial peptide transport system permease subunit